MSVSKQSDIWQETEPFSLSERQIDVASLRFDDDRAGACVVFEGRVRNNNEGKSVKSLAYEAYDRMAVAEGNKIIEEAVNRFDIVDARCVHRVGKLEIGEIAVWIAVLAAHRTEAFTACRYIIDEVKSRVPIWKKEHYLDGESEWVAPDGELKRP